MFVRNFGLVPNRDDADRFVVLTRWETREDAWRTVPVRYEYSWLNGRWAPTRITERSWGNRWPVIWPKGVDGESETLRRKRIMAVRAAIHVDPGKASTNPWEAAYALIYEPERVPAVHELWVDELDVLDEEIALHATTGQ